MKESFLVLTFGYFVRGCGHYFIFKLVFTGLSFPYMVFQMGGVHCILSRFDAFVSALAAHNGTCTLKLEACVSERDCPC